jgi:hypothetical protein
MKKTNSFKLFLLATVCCLSNSLFASHISAVKSDASNPVLIATFADLQTAYTASQSGAPGTTYLQFTADITTTATYSFVPDADHPVSIDANGKLFKVANSGTLGGSLTLSSNTTRGIIRISGATVTTINGGTYSVTANNAPIIYGESSSGIDNLLTKVIASNATFTVNGFNVASGPSAASIVKFFTSNGNLFSATNCTFNMSAQGIAFSCIGPQDIFIKDCTLNFSGSDVTGQVFNFAPSNAGVVAGSITVDGLALTMAAGNIFTTGGSRPINMIVRNISLNGNANAALAVPAGGSGAKKFYDFRAYTPTVSVAPGSYASTQSVNLTLAVSGIAPVDAGAATFVYTLDGTDPLTTSLTATPVSIGTPTTIKIAAKSADGLFLGKVYSFAYTFGTTSVDNLQDNTLISVSPTVVTDKVTVSRTAKHIMLLDVAGKLMGEYSNTSQFDMSNFKSGVYMIKIEMPTTSVKTFKVVKL